MDLNENLIFKLKGKQYTIAFPRVGEYRSIEAMKQTLSMNTYSSMYRAMMASTEEAMDMVDIEAYLSVLCPDVIKDLKCNSLSDLGLLDYKELKTAFKGQFIPWWNEIENLLHPQPKTKKVENEETEQD